MGFPFRVWLFGAAIFAGAATSYSVFAEEQYDRLDGTGASGKKMDVVEWEGNLELHVSPKGTTGGIGAKLDDRTEGKKVLVMGIRLKTQKEVLVRRAILGVPFTANVKGFIDPTEKDYDKIALSNQTLGPPWKPYKLDTPPKNWYPDGDERNEADPASVKEPVTTPRLGKKPAGASDRVPAADGSLNQYNW